MEKYIPLDAVLAEIESLLDKGKYHEEYDCAYRDGNNSALYALKEKIDTIEVKEVDLEKEYEEFVVDDHIFGHFITNDTLGIELAKHFFELGMQVSNKAQKGE